jgi:hypothetical protein
MKAWCIAATALISGHLMAATATFTNTSNAALGDDFVLGDNYKLTITGAAHNAAVVVDGTINGNGLSPDDVGNTDANGDFTLTGNWNSSGYIGEWTEQWKVGGVNVGSTFDFDVIDAPTGLTLGPVVIPAVPTACFGLNYGIDIDIQYQITGASGQIHTTIDMYPWETGEAYGVGGVDLGPFNGPIGPVVEYSDSTQYASVLGVFHDVPVGACFAATFSGAGAQQNLQIKVGNLSYPINGNVRSQRFQIASTGQFHGSITNNSDISKSQ